MHARSLASRRTLPALLVGLALLSGGCSGWSPVTLPAPADSAWTIRGRLRVADSSGGLTLGTSAAVRDSALEIIGIDGMTRSITFGRLARVERYHSNGVGTALLVGAGIVGVFLILAPDPDYSGCLSCAPAPVAP